MLALIFAAPASFAIPIDDPTSTLVYAVGGYRFAALLRIGQPMNWS